MKNIVRACINCQYYTVDANGRAFCTVAFNLCSIERSFAGDCKKKGKWYTPKGK